MPPEQCQVDMATGSTTLGVRKETARVEAALGEHADPERARQEKRYLKSRLDFMGVGIPVTRRVVKRWLRSHPELDRADLLRLTRALWRRRVHELRVSAIELLRARERLLLREVGKKRPELVRDFLLARLPRVSSTTLREGVKYLPDFDREALLQARAKR